MAPGLSSGPSKTSHTPQRNSFIDIGRESVWTILSKFPPPSRSEPDSSMHVGRVERSRPRPPPLLLFPKPDHSSLPYLQASLPPSPNTASTIASFAATGSIRSPWPVHSPRPDGGEFEYDELHRSMVMRSRWSSDSGSDYSVDDSPLSPTFLHSWNQNQTSTSGQLTSTSSSLHSPPISTLPARRRSSMVLCALSPRTIPWSPPKTSNGSGRSSQNQAQENISPPHPLRYTLRNSDGSWKVVDAYGKLHVIPALPPTRDVKGEDEDKKRKETGDDVQWQFRRWRGFRARGQQS